VLIAASVTALSTLLPAGEAETGMSERAETVMEHAARGSVVRADPQTYLTALRGLRAGDRLLLEPGVYREGHSLHGLIGELGHPIVVEGSNAGASVFVARAGRNTVSILDAAHVVIRNLVLDGRGLPVDAVKAEGHTRFARLVNPFGMQVELDLLLATANQSNDLRERSNAESCREQGLYEERAA
jgi:hypothetical protein